MTTILCTKCKLLLDISNFYKNKRKRGFEYWCKTCKTDSYRKREKIICLCGGQKHWLAKECRKCSSAHRRGPLNQSFKTGRIISKGYVYLISHDHPYRNTKNRISEHRHVMEQHLGRYLRDNENVHHKNGNRSDNRIENLELWIKSQPSGQRPEDLVKWAKEIIELYGSELLSEAPPTSVG